MGLVNSVFQFNILSNGKDDEDSDSEDPDKKKLASQLSG